MNKTQILYIGGGTTFKSKSDYISALKKKSPQLEKYNSWSEEYLDKNLGPKYKIIRPKMPCKENAKYEEWKIIFENYLKAMNTNVILIGCSLGGIFLAKYLSENKIKKNIIATFLIAPPYDNTCPGEDLVGGFILRKDLSPLEKQGGKVTLCFSKDDPVVPISHAEKYRAKLNQTKIITYKSKKGHFFVSTFPEIVRMIKEL